MNPQLQEAFDRSVADAPEWLVALRREGAESFDAQAMPNEKMEHWRYVELDFDLDTAAVAGPGAIPLAAGPYVQAAGDLAGQATVVDGFVTDLSSDLPEGVRFASVRDALLTDDEGLRRSLGKGIELERDKFAAAHRAFAGDGIYVRVDPSVVVDRPLLIDVQAVADDVVSFPHITIDLDRASQVSVIVNYRSPDSGTRQVIPQIEVTVGDGARLELTTLQHWGRSTTAAVHQKVVLGRDATATVGEVGLGGSLARLDLEVDLVGNGSSAELIGLSFGDLDQTHDYRVVMRHVGTNTSSNVFLKGAVEDRASSVFTGLLRIEEGAVRTSAFETNRNLVLSDEARAQSVPNLEILCDDVVCGHGSTVGQLEEDHLYYLMSRGLPRDRAERLLVRGFFEEVIARLPASAVGDVVRDAVHAKFLAAQEEGRLG